MLAAVDHIETWGGSTIQHGRLSNRVYLMRLAREDYPAILGRLDGLAVAEGYTKVFAKVPSWAVPGFTERGYALEAAVPGFYRGVTDGLFMAKYLGAARGVETRPELVRQVLDAARAKGGPTVLPALPPGHEFIRTSPDDVPEMARVYRAVFETYPFPIHDPAFLASEMESGHTAFFGIRDAARIVALSSAEMDANARNAEMTDFAALPECRGQGLGLYLLRRMEEAVRGLGIDVAYTIARAYSFGMNVTFARGGYNHAGTLTNNTNISGGLESMNVWYKGL